MIAVVIRRDAEADVAGTRSWYAREDPQLGTAFALEFSRTVDRIGALPDQFPAVGQDVRRALLHRFPYACYFVRRADQAVVVAVLHQHRKPGGWKHRANREE
jgi:plasmid stabilization system protein ParE